MHRTRRLALALAPLLLALGAVTLAVAHPPAAHAGAGKPAAHHGLSATAGRPLTFLHSAAPRRGLAQIVDAHGRSVLLRGVNIDGLVDYWKPSLHKPYPTRPSAYRHHRCPKDDQHVEGVPICWFDFREMRRIGYDNIRLNVSWSLLEPRPGHINRRYVRRIAQVVRWAKRQGIWTTIDMHQDAWSKFVYTKPTASCPPGTGRTRGYDGAPRWASRSRLPACAIDNTRELDLAVQDDAQDFWTDLDAPDGVGLQEHYAHVIAVLAKRFAHDPAVAGYDLMNEPEPGFLPEAANTAELLPFYAKVARTIRAKVPGFRQLLFFEPGVERNTTAQRAFFTPWSSVSAYRNVVYAPHIYTDVFTAGAVLGTPELSTFGSDYRAAVGDAKALGIPLWVGEYGGPPADDNAILRRHYAQQEMRRIGGTMWLWKENANDTIANTFWGIYGPPFTGRGVPQPKRVRRTSGSIRWSPPGGCCATCRTRSVVARSWWRGRPGFATVTDDTARSWISRRRSRGGSRSAARAGTSSGGPAPERSGCIRGAGHIGCASNRRCHDAPMDGATAEIAACVAGVGAAQQRLIEAIAGLTDDAARSDSLLPGWTVGHLLTHIARNADSHVRMLRGAIAGEPMTQYDGGHEARTAGIEAGATRSADELIEDIVTSSAELDLTYDAMTADAWASHGLNAGGEIWPCAAMPFHRWREVELHHVDLGLGYAAADWPDEYVDRELAISLELLPERLGSVDQRAVLAWLVGRSAQPTGLAITAWQGRPDHYLR